MLGRWGASIRCLRAAGVRACVLDPMAGSPQASRESCVRWVGGGVLWRGDGHFGCFEETDEGRRDDRVGNSPGEGLLRSAGPVPFNFKLTDLLVHNG